MGFIHLSLKNLIRRKGRTVLTILGVAFAVAVLFSLLAFNAGYSNQLNHDLQGLGIDLLAVPKGCPYEAASMILQGGMIPNYLDYSDLPAVHAVDNIDIATPLLLQQFFQNDQTQTIFGINADEMQRLKPWWHVEGRFFTDGEKQVLVLGRNLAKNAKLKVGDIVPFGPASIPFTIIGILNQTGDEDDESYFLPIAEVQTLFDKQNQMTAVAVKLNDITKIAEVSSKLEDIPDIQTVTMNQVMGTILNLVGSAKTLLMSVIIVAIFISAVGIVNTLLMSINERRQEFGMMKAIGASGLDIGRMILLETLFITISGGIVGVVVSVLGSSVVEHFVRGIIPYAPAGKLVSFTPQLFGLSIVFSVVIGIICGLYPAIRSSRVTPMEAIRSSFE
jgi:putative ABC transport system permease protein